MPSGIGAMSRTIIEPMEVAILGAELRQHDAGNEALALALSQTRKAGGTNGKPQARGRDRNAHTS
jgi:hypothetical protein